MNTQTVLVKEEWPDLIRAIAILLVVGVHVSGAILNQGFGSGGLFSYWIAALVNSLGRMGVPLFFMLSGSLLLVSNKPLAPLDFIKRRASRIGYAFLFWSLFYCIVILIRGQNHNPLGLILSLVYQPAYYHLWYFYSIIGLYLITPILLYATRNVLWYVTIFWFIASILCCIPDRFLGFTINGNFTHILPVYIGFFTLGALLRTWKLPPSYTTRTLWIGIFAFATTLLGYTIASANHAKAVSDYFFDYLSIAVVAQTISAFLLIKHFGSKPLHTSLKNGIRWVSTTSMGIFVLHPLILEWFSSGWFGITLNAFWGGAFIGIPLTMLVTVLVCSGITTVLQRIPYLRACV